HFSLKLWMIQYKRSFFSDSHSKNLKYLLCYGCDLFYRFFHLSFSTYLSYAQELNVWREADRK
ncbi:MAG: hypothetical protein ACOCZL_05695, partial [Bacteroidota bacterium]